MNQVAVKISIPGCYPRFYGFCAECGCVDELTSQAASNRQVGELCDVCCDEAPPRQGDELPYLTDPQRYGAEVNQSSVSLRHVVDDFFMTYGAFRK